MEIFESEIDLIKQLENHFQIISDFAYGEISYKEFDDKYNSFYYYYALDGHESDEEEKILLKKYSDKIELFEKVSSILSGICSDEDSVKDIYIKSGRYSSEVSKNKIKQLVISYKNIFNAV